MPYRGETLQIAVQSERDALEQVNLYLAAEEDSSGILSARVVSGDGSVEETWQIDIDAPASDEVLTVSLVPEETLKGISGEGLFLVLDASQVEGSLFLTGYTLLYGSISRRTIYLFLAAAAVLLLGGAFLSASPFGRGLKEEQRYLMLALPAGILFILALPYTQCPDDMYHFMRIWDVMEGNVISAKVGESVGGYLPANLTAGLDWGSGYREIYRAMEQTVDTDTTQWYYFANSALYSPVAYIPEILGVAIARLFTNRVLLLTAAGRLSGYLFSVTLVYHAIRLMPCRRQLIVIIAMTPMFLQEASALGTDYFVNSLLLLYVASICHFIYADVRIRGRQMLLLTILSFCVAMCKVVYLPLCLLLLLIPKEKFADAGARAHKRIFCWGNILFGTVCNLGWTAMVSGYVDYFAKGGVDSRAQVILVLTHPFRYILVMYRTLMASAADYVLEMFGDHLGYIANISIGNVIPLLLIAAFLWICWDESSDLRLRGSGAQGPADLRRIDLLAFAALIVVIVVLTFTSLYVQYTDYAESMIDGLQGRYFIPLLLPAGLLLSRPAAKRNRPSGSGAADGMKTPPAASDQDESMHGAAGTNVWWLYPLLGYTTAYTLIQILCCV